MPSIIRTAVLCAAVSVLLGLSATPAAAAAAEASPDAKAPGAQQSRMAKCNTDAKAQALKGDDRKAFMKTCLSTRTASVAATAEQAGKTKSCNTEAKGKAGDERKAFLKECQARKAAA